MKPCITTIKLDNLISSTQQNVRVQIENYKKNNLKIGKKQS